MLESNVIEKVINEGIINSDVYVWNLALQILKNVLMFKKVVQLEPLIALKCMYLIEEGL